MGAVTILTDGRIVFQGQILKDDYERHHWKDDDDDKCCCPPPPLKVEVEAKLDDDPDFIVLKLTCAPAIIKENACIQEMSPIFLKKAILLGSM